MDLTPLIPSGRQIIETYGDGRFCITGMIYHGSVIVFPTRTLLWDVRAVDEVSIETLSPVVSDVKSGDSQLLLLGCGSRLTMIPRQLRLALRNQGLLIEPMDTGAAARTFNVLMAEGRNVAAALIAVE